MRKLGSVETETPALGEGKLCFHHGNRSIKTSTRAVQDQSEVGLNLMSITGNGTQKLHDEYCRLTHLNIPLSLQRMYAWEMWSLEFKLPDLEIVVRHIERKVKDRGRLYRCFKFEWFICNRENFAEDLAEARALMRVHRPNPHRDEVLRITGRPEKQPDIVHTPAEILASQEALKKLVALRDSLLPSPSGPI